MEHKEVLEPHFGDHIVPAVYIEPI
jgi:hypothetical protein